VVSSMLVIVLPLLPGQAARLTFDTDGMGTHSPQQCIVHGMKTGLRRGNCGGVYVRRIRRIIVSPDGQSSN
jgi:hypothetical protein